MRIHQLVASMTPGDATSNHVLEIDKRLTSWGFESAIFAQHRHPELKHRVRPLEELQPYLTQKDDVLIYHYGIFHFSLHLFQSAQCLRVLIYHNITPAEFFAGWDKSNQNNCNLGRISLQRLINCDLAIGDSDFNRQELVAEGFTAAKTAVVPIFLPVDEWTDLPSDEALKKSLRQRNVTNWLTVGRIAPNKAIEDVIRTFYVYKSQINPQAHLYLVGSQSIPTYADALRALVADLDLADSVTFTGRVSDSQLKTYYQNADLFFSASHHEGFCVPLIESMFFGLPILARNATAIPETLGQSGVLFNQLGHLDVAQAAHMLTTDHTFRQRVIATQQERLQAFLPQTVETKLQQALQQLGLTSSLEST